MKSKKLLAILITTMPILVSAQTIYESKIEALLQKMTIEEKIGQLVQYNGFWDATGPLPKDVDDSKKYEDIKNGKVGSMLNVMGTKQVRAIQKLAVENSRLGIPLIFGMDVIHGYKTSFPVPLAEAASWDLELIKKSARISATEAASAGVNWTFAPMIDISRNPRWGRVMEGAGEDPYLGAKIGVARVQGFQGDNLADPLTIAACAKHFVGYGFTEDGKDYNTVDVGTSTLYNILLPPFKAVIDNNVKTCMNAFNVLNGIPSTGNKFIQRAILKGIWDFNGFVVSDWGSINELQTHGFVETQKQAAETAINAGCDMDMESNAYGPYLQELIKEGKVDIATINDAVRRILRVKFELGLFDDPYAYCNPKREQKYLLHKDHMQASLEIAKNAIVLLKNQNNMLPLTKTQKNIAVIGAIANDKDSPLGNWRGLAESNSAVSVLEGLSTYTKEITYAEGAKVALNTADFGTGVIVNNTDTSGFAEAITVAKKSEIVIMVLGETGFQTGEGRSRMDIGLPGVQQQLLEAVYRVNKNIILVLSNGRPLTIPWADAHIPAIVETWHLGSQSGNAIAQVLFGDHNPSGKLPVTFPRHVGQIPIYYNHYHTGRPEPQGSICYSHYADGEKTPLYPFGYGLSYTEFTYSKLQINDSNPKNILVQVQITNTGKVAGTEIAQLYIRDNVASTVRPVKELKGFKKLTLQAGQTETITFTLTENELGFFNQIGEFIIEPGLFEVMVGTNSQKGIQGSFILK